MLPDLRRYFNRNFSPAKYRDFLWAFERRCGTPIEFRICETPCFFPKSLLDQMSTAGIELTEQLLHNAEYRKISDASVPAEYNVPNENPTPLFVQVDFGLVRHNGRVEPRLVELQAFPSLYAYQSALAEQYVESYGLPNDLGIYLSGLNADTYRQALTRAIVGDHAAANVVLLEITPQKQKTLADFLLTEKLCGVTTVDIADLAKQGSKLFYTRNGKLIPIHRIYNRVIVDELVRKKIKIPFDYRDSLDIEWAGHPNWYFRISKFSIPYLRHWSVPTTQFLSDVERLPDDRENYVLKQLYSFAGAGITFDPTEKDVAAIPPDQRHNYILQERMRFEPVIETPHGPTQAEVRIMYLYLDRLTPVLGLVRMGRGKMMGVDHNKDLDWVGASAALWRAE